MKGKLIMSGTLHVPPSTNGSACTYLVYENADDTLNVYLMSTAAVGSVVDSAENISLAELGEWLIGRLYY